MNSVSRTPSDGLIYPTGRGKARRLRAPGARGRGTGDGGGLGRGEAVKWLQELGSELELVHGGRGSRARQREKRAAERE